jgi:PAS domain-containing protein
MLLGKDMEIKIMNRACAKYYGVADLKGAIGKICSHVLNCSSEACRECRVPMAISHGKNITFERNKPTDPNKYEKIVIYTVEDKGNKIGSVIMRISDITERKMFERQLIQIIR